ncbi:hypothetical protein [Povalibacter sp.]|uniref:helix-turn-helix transcriptional regulator n=1 Tax=Povalibacter sp. TaxID=1962978 RepID=UPI002F41E027
MSTQPFTPITREQAAQILSVSIATIDNWIVKGILPKPKGIGERLVYWHPDTFYSRLHALLQPEVAQGSEKAALSPPQQSMETKRPTRKNDAVDRSERGDAARLARLNQK